MNLFLAHENLKKLASKVAHFTVLARLPKPDQNWYFVLCINMSYIRLICPLFCGPPSLSYLDIRELRQAKLKLDMYLMDFFTLFLKDLNLMNIGVVTHVFIKNEFQMFTIFWPILLFSWNMRWLANRRYIQFCYGSVPQIQLGR